MSLPKHVAIIMDGNGRWGIKKKKTRNFGHKKGLEIIEKIVDFSIKKRISALTLYTFSTENWKRPKREINFLFKLLHNFLNKNTQKIINKGIKLKFIGDNSLFSKDLKKTLIKIEKATKENKKIHVNIALNYGSKNEIIQCIKILIKKQKKITDKNIKNYLYTSGMPDPDILIRTGGKKRLSNFLLWQLAYSELFFLNKLWPDFNNNDFLIILRKFSKIKRNFGSI
tara:strand:- start:656 stop:1333 length:678 start_codon:yes stop_codon:yes gene_type:complete